jgi:N-formylmaleamate deformylase
MSAWLEHDILANGIRLHYYRTDKAETAAAKRGSVVLCHGYSDDGLCWSALARELAADYDVVMVDARYHGRSEVPREPGGPDVMSADLASLIETLELERPVVAGHSMGASYVFRAAALYPEHLRAVILEDPVWFDGEMTRSGPDRRAQLEHHHELPLEELIAEFRELHRTWDEETLALFAAAKKRLSPRMLDQGLAFHPWRETLAQVQCPMLVFTGDPSLGAIVTDAVFEEAQRIHGQIERVHIPGVGHHIRYEAPHPYTQAVRRYLAGIFG